MKTATAQDLFHVYAMARTAAMRARDNGKAYIATIKRKDTVFGFMFIATNEPKPCHASFSGNVAVTAENMLYALAQDSPVPVKFNANDVDDYLGGA